jgi:hypothetical protein
MSQPVFVRIPCPSGKHQHSILTFKNHTVAALFCLPCEHAWTEAASHPELSALPTTDFRDMRRHGE